MEQQNKKMKMNNIFYAIIGLATLIVATVGATFAYFTATASNNTTVKGDMSQIGFDLHVTKVTTVDDDKGGMIPMSNNMMEQALQSAKGTCVDNNGNAVCQIYKITVINNSTASMFLDGYVTLSNGSGIPEDIGPKGKNLYAANALSGKTTMRWAQAFCTETSGAIGTQACTTAGNSTVRSSNTIAYAALGGASVAANGYNTTEILSTRSEIASTTAATINGNTYEALTKNYIRISTPHVAGETSYTRDADPTSALVFNQYLNANDNVNTNHAGDSNDSNKATGTADAYTDAQVYYIVVWLSENGHNQTTNAPETDASTTKTDFFKGSVTFITAQGSEVTATFSGHTRVTPNTPIS